jgi:hypothetical protein
MRRRTSRSVVVSFLLFSVCGLVTAALGAEVDRFAGEWRGANIESNDGFEVAAKDLLLKLVPGDGGFELEWKAPGGAVEHAGFVASENQPGVFSAKASSGGLLGFFSSSEEVDPLEGDPLTWARLDGDAFILYKLVIDERGAFTLDRYENTLQGETIRLRFTRRSHAESEQALVARLGRGGN